MTDPNEDPGRKNLQLLSGGVALGTALATVAFATFMLLQPTPAERAPAAVCPPPVCPACPPAAACPPPACPACAQPPATVPSLPSSVPPVPPVPSRRDEASSDPTSEFPEQTPASPPTAQECERALRRPMQVSDERLFDCAREGLLGSCHVWPQCPTCACRWYVGTEELCKDGTCGEPLNGTGCASETYYGARSAFFNCQGSDAQVAGCMVRKLAKAGYCKRQESR